VDIDVSRGAALEHELIDAGHVVHFLHVDVRDIPALQRAITSAAKSLGPIRVLVNNAADDTRRPSTEVEVADWDNGIAVNVRHHFFAAQAVLPMMKAAGGGSIINLGSISRPGLLCNGQVRHRRAHAHLGP
jgi:NAD(P)-dependent dehydrogenase (short-subunit alcohol dehydrogenase family)